MAHKIEYQRNPRYAPSSNQSGLSCVLAYGTGFGILDSFVVYFTLADIVHGTFLQLSETTE